MTCSPDYAKATTVEIDGRMMITGGILVLTPCTCGDEDHGFAARVYPDAFFTSAEGAQPHLEGS